MARGTAFAFIFISVADPIGVAKQRSPRAWTTRLRSRRRRRQAWWRVTSAAALTCALGLYGDRAAIGIHVGRRRTTRAEPVLELAVLR
ncbi:hypothetical protein N7U49_00320 [Streptomyces sp. AD2-2]|nr:hypothetical protein N7U49_00320 [Streptomyces sp. AD2-2]